MREFILENNSGMRAVITDFGAAVKSLYVSDRSGAFIDVACGYDTESGYESGDKYFGAVIGRCANRIAGGRFSLNGREVRLTVNNGKNHLHGGENGFHKKTWETDGVVKSGFSSRITLTLLSPDGEEGYPGSLKASATYSLTNDNGLIIDYSAVSDADTIFNPTFHGYFNLSGFRQPDIRGHIMRINARHVTESGADSIPTGRVISLAAPENAALSFMDAKPVGRDIGAAHPMLKNAGGYDFNYILKKSVFNYKRPQMAAECSCPESGVKMAVYTDRPGVHFYTGNFLGGDKGKGGIVYGRQSAFCLETQSPPDAVNHPDFKSPVLKAGKAFSSRTVYMFSVE